MPLQAWRPCPTSGPVQLVGYAVASEAGGTSSSPQLVLVASSGGMVVRHNVRWVAVARLADAERDALRKTNSQRPRFFVSAASFGCTCIPSP